MPVVRDSGGARAASSAGLYQSLVDREEAVHHDWVTNHVLGRGGQRYGQSRRLAALRAGRPVTLSLHEFPEWARPLPLPPPFRTQAEADRLRREAPQRYEEQRQLTGSGWTVYADDRVVRGVHDSAPTALDEFLDL
ncbi:hypothetical protein MINTM005_24090 [Mycobacterium intracellulare]|nr:hypothetical protein MINTM005_24090 [Mycobacterium intracellulare]BCO94269.1 hypothetical protein MINTM016_22450 [Mycobacterium intracellulare]